MRPLFLLLFALPLGAALPPSRINPDWNLAGVEDKSLQQRATIVDLTAAPWNVLPDGTDQGAKLQAALDASSNDGKVLLLGKGNTIVRTQPRMRRPQTLRGWGTDQTTLTVDASSASKGAIYVGQYYDDNQWISVDITAGAIAGASNLTVTSSSGFAPGQVVLVDVLNDNILVSNQGTFTGLQTWISRLNGTRTLNALHQIKNVSGNIITVWPRLASTFTNTLSPQLSRPGNTGATVGIGIENMSIRYNPYAGDWGIFLSGCRDCWVTNVDCFNAPIMGHIQLNQCMRCEVRGNYFHTIYNGYPTVDAYVPSHGYGIECQRLNSWNLIENNIIEDVVLALVQSCGGMGNVWGWNYPTNVHRSAQPKSGTKTDPTDSIDSVSPNHAGHPRMNLWEGNKGEKSNADNLMGGSSYNTYHRNYFWGWSTAHYTDSRGIEINTRNWFFNAEANVLGNPTAPGSGTAAIYEQYNTDSGWNTPTIWRLNYESNGDGTAGDNDVNPRATLIRNGNYDYVNHDVVWNPANMSGGTTNLVASYYLSGKPSWWGANWVFPAIGPDIPGMTNSYPAERRHRGIAEGGSGALAPMIIGQPSDRTVLEGQDANFSVNASGTAPLFYQWQKNLVNLLNLTNATLTISQTTTADAGGYTCIVSNSVGVVQSRTALLAVNSGAVATFANGSFESGFGSWLANGNVFLKTSDPTYPARDGATLVAFNSGNSVNNGSLEQTFLTQVNTLHTVRFDMGALSFVNTGIQSLRVEVIGQGTLFSQTYDLPAPGNGTTWASQTFNFTPNSVNTTLKFSDVGSVTVNADMLLDAVSVTSEVVTPFGILVQPNPVTVNEGQAASFSVSVEGTPPFTYQWRQDGVVIPGATSSTYSIPSPTVFDAGNYDVFVTGQQGTIASLPATLTVIAGMSPSPRIRNISPYSPPGGGPGFRLVRP